MISFLKIRFIVFLIGCIGFRAILTLASYLSEGWGLQMLGFFAIYPVLYWFYTIFIAEKNSGLKVVNDLMWWNHLRPIHMLLWAFFAYLALSKNRMAYMVLLIDTVFGALAFFLHHWSEGNL
jgi:hypothetical protein